MSCRAPYNFVDQEKDDQADEVFGGGFVDLVPVVDLSGNLIMRLNKAYREHHHLVWSIEVGETLIA